MGQIAYINRILSGENDVNMLLEQLSEKQKEQLGNRIRKEAFMALGYLQKASENDG